MNTDLIIKNASQLLTVKSPRGFKVGKELLDLGIVENGAIAIADDKIAAVGTTSEIIKKFPKPKKIIDAKNKVVMPGLIDPHTHLVYWGSRAHEYEAKILGKSYSEIHSAQKDADFTQNNAEKKATGSGILYTVEQTRKASKKELIKKALKDLKLMLEYGTTTCEAKSGYGLDKENEIKILEVIKELKNLQPIDIISTFLGAHTIPEEYKNNRAGYIALVKNLLPEIKKKNLAEFCDVFCDKLGFTIEETREILEAAKKSGFKLKLHAEQTGYLGGAKLGTELKATSCDHLDYISDEDITLLAQEKIAGVLLPTVTYHLMEMSPNPSKNYGVSKPFLPERVRKIIESKMVIALATDYNPGSSPCLSMKTVMECAARLYRMRPAEIISACAINAAYAIDRQNSIGSLEPGKKADIIILDCERYEELINSFGTNLVKTVIKNGKVAD